MVKTIQNLWQLLILHGSMDGVFSDFHAHQGRQVFGTSWLSNYTNGDTTDNCTILIILVYIIYPTIMIPVISGHVPLFLLVFCFQILEDEVTASRPTLREASWGSWGLGQRQSC